MLEAKFEDDPIGNDNAVLRLSPLRLLRIITFVLRGEGGFWEKANKGEQGELSERSHFKRFQRQILSDN